MIPQNEIPAGEKVEFPLENGVAAAGMGFGGLWGWHSRVRFIQGLRIPFLLFQGSPLQPVRSVSTHNVANSFGIWGELATLLLSLCHPAAGPAFQRHQHSPAPGSPGGKWLPEGGWMRAGTAATTACAPPLLPDHRHRVTEDLKPFPFHLQRENHLVPLT